MINERAMSYEVIYVMVMNSICIYMTACMWLLCLNFLCMGASTSSYHGYQELRVPWGSARTTSWLPRDKGTTGHFLADAPEVFMD